MSKIIMLGTDPELFVIGADGKIGSVAGLLGCDKWNQKDLGNGIFLQEDNVLIEYATAPSDSFDHFNSIIKLGIDSCVEALDPLNMGIAAGTSSHVFTLDELNSFHKSVFEFGCEPDFNALTGRVNPKPKAANAGLRTAGGHVHLGYAGLLPEEMGLEQSQAVVGVMCDYFLGLPSLLMDTDDQRRELYGKAGSIRKKDYGIEYRSLSNFWIFEEAKRRMVWDQAHAVLKTLDGSYERLAGLIDPNEIHRIINENDKRAAEKAIAKLQVI